MQKWFYVLELEGGRYYAGIANDLQRRVEEHVSGIGAEWTKRHKPLRVVFSHAHEVPDSATAERLENLLTVELMIRHGLANVRGGHYCALNETSIELPLKAHGHWDRIRQSSLGGQRVASDWHAAVAKVLELAEIFHDGNCARTDGDQLLLQLLAMKTHRHWHADFDPALKEAFWGRRGLLTILLGFKLNRVVGYKLKDLFSVLATALQRGHGGNCPWSHLFFAGWDAFKPSASASQEAAVEVLRAKHAASTRDTQFDAFTSILFPELRWRLR